MNDFIDLLLLSIWRRAGAFGILVAAIFCGLLVVLVFSLLSDPPTPGSEIAAAAKESWAGQVIGFRYDPARGLIAAVEGSSAQTEVMFSGIETPPCDHQTPLAALTWLRRKAPAGKAIVVHVLEPANTLNSMRGHLVAGNDWLNGSLVERGLMQVSKASSVARYNAGRDALRALQEEAHLHQRGLWRSGR